MRSLMSKAALLASVACLVALSACRPPSKAGPAFSTREQMAEADASPSAGLTGVLGTSDVLEVRVYQEPDLSGAFRVSQDGSIDYPFCGRLKATGLTSTALVDLLTTCLKKGYLKKPQVTVFLKEYNSKKVFVFGEVQKPGTFPFEDNMNVIQAITLAGGFTKVAAKNSVVVTRLFGNEEKKVEVHAQNIGEGREKNFGLQPGDIVFVPEGWL